MQLDVKALGAELAQIVSAQVAPLLERIKALEAREPIPGPAGPVGPAGADGKDGKDGIGEKGADGLGMAGSMIDRDGNLLMTMTNGEVKNLGPVVGKDGSNGSDGKDGLSLESFELEYIEDAHEVCVKAVCQGRVKEIRYPAGGIRGKGYWREGTKAVPGDAWTEGGSLWYALKETASKPSLNNDAWFLAARAGRDGERGASAKPVNNAPIKLGA